MQCGIKNICKKIKMHLQLSNQRGSTIAVVVFALLGLVAMTGLVVDGGSLYVTKSHLQKTANAAVLSSAQELTNSYDNVIKVANDVLKSHQEQESLQEIDVTMFNYVHIFLSKSVTTPFFSIFGKQQVEVIVDAKAQIGTMGRAYGAVPLGIEDGITLDYNTVYRLKVEEDDVDTGNFGVLALGGSGAATYEDNLKYGYQGEIGLGDILNTETGNIAGKTRSGIKERIDACPYPKGETFHRDCPRIMLVPVYEPHNHTQNQMKEVKVTGFSYFYIMEPIDNRTKAITGMFIKRAGSGTFEAGASDKGAYIIRLVK